MWNACALSLFRKLKLIFVIKSFVLITVMLIKNNVYHTTSSFVTLKFYHCIILNKMHNSIIYDLCSIKNNKYKYIKYITSYKS